jgi:Tat protein translocase TatB subunit
MFFAFIFESIGTSELMLIGLVALIVFGPRKLPELARTLGKTMAEFRRSTDDFKKTWQQELDLEEAKKNLEMLADLRDEDEMKIESSVSRNSLASENPPSEPSVPEVKEISKEDFEANAAGERAEQKARPQTVKANSKKSDWL